VANGQLATGNRQPATSYISYSFSTPSFQIATVGVILPRLSRLGKSPMSREVIIPVTSLSTLLTWQIQEGQNAITNGEHQLALFASLAPV
jgi:hypothetical protein